MDLTEALRAIKVGVAAEDLGWEQAREVETFAFRTTWGSPANKHALATAKKKIRGGGEEEVNR